MDTLRGLEGKIQIYLPDLKYVTPEYAEQYSGAADYPEAARRPSWRCSARPAPACIRTAC